MCGNIRVAQFCTAIGHVAHGQRVSNVNSLLKLRVLSPSCIHSSLVFLFSQEKIIVDAFNPDTFGMDDTLWKCGQPF
jgi:hypothetical protein